MSSYSSDRSFTDFVHTNVAIPTIYNQIGWIEQNIHSSDLQELDLKHGIDYVFKDENGALKTVQERFREAKYARYSDFTIRYRRDRNLHSERIQSEYYKMKANYFTYGIINGNKNEISNQTNFLKIAIIDLKKIYEKIDTGEIYIRDNGQNTCRIVDGKIECPVKYNGDGSSSFFPIDISFLINLWGEEMAIYKKGF